MDATTMHFAPFGRNAGLPQDRLGLVDNDDADIDVDIDIVDSSLVDLWREQGDDQRLRDGMELEISGVAESWAASAPTTLLLRLRVKTVRWIL